MGKTVATISTLQSVYVFVTGATMKFLTVYLLGMFIPYLYVIYLIRLVFEMLVPIMGRSGSEAPPDVVMGIFIVVMCIFLSSYLVR